MISMIVLGIVVLVLLVMIAAAIARALHPGFVAIPFALLALLWVLFSVTTVEAKEIGVVKTFGKTGDKLGPGAHMKLPWQSVVHLDGTVQTDEYRGDGCITVVLSDKNTACISATNRWSVAQDNADVVVANYRSGDPTADLRDSVVSTEFKAAVFDAFGDVDPTAAGALDTAGLAAEIKTATESASGGLVEIGRVTISYIRLGEKAQAKIDAIEGQKAQTAIANEKKATATAEAAANKILSDSISNDPNVLVSKCFDLISDGFKPAAGFQCWPGGSGSVVIPSATTP